MLISGLMVGPANLVASQTLAHMDVPLIFTVDFHNVLEILNETLNLFPAVESIQANRFFAHLCPARDDISSRRCTLTPGAWMGGDGINYHKSLTGSFYLETNRNSPHAQGPTRP